MKDTCYTDLYTKFRIHKKTDTKEVVETSMITHIDDRAIITTTDKDGTRTKILSNQ